METGDALVTLIVTYGPTIMSTIGTVMSIIIGLALWAVKTAWTLHSQKIDELSLSVRELARRMEEWEDDHRKERLKMWDALSALKRDLDDLKAETQHLEETLKEVQTEVLSSLERLSKVEAVVAKAAAMEKAPRKVIVGERKGNLGGQ